VHDVTRVEPLLEDLPLQQVVAEKGYDPQQLIDLIHARQGKANIPARASNHYPREFDAHEYQARNLVERFFNCIKHFRRIATRDEKLNARYIAMLSILLALIWLA
jgi:transposase